ncbi:MAG: hypothetical protein M0R51_09045, partial [Clostridia bacterium]|nr:hypothetical protein [Clostridia bacterium]
MLISYQVKVKWHGSNKNYYVNKGYIFTKINDIFMVKFEDLLPSGSQRILLKCDYQKDGCRDIYDKKISDYYKNNIKSNIHSDCCKNPLCMKEKRRESVRKTYGCDNSNQIPEVKQRRKETCQELYGGNSPMCSSEIREKSKITIQKKYNVDYISQVEEIKQQKRKTSLEHFGVEHPMQSEGVREKAKDTSFKRYGKQYYSQTDECKNKTIITNNIKYGVDWYLSLVEPHELSKKTCLEKYGVEYPIALEEFQNKARQTMFKNNTAPCSAQQEYLSDFYRYKLNYLVGNCFLDMVSLNEQIYIEYQGSGHNLRVKMGDMTQDEFNKKEINRGYFLSKQGWKRIEIISTKDKLPSNLILFYMLEYAKKYISTEHLWIKFDIDNSKVKTSQYEKQFNFGKLRKITKKDV